MADTNVNKPASAPAPAPAPKRRRRWPKILGIIFGVLILLLVVAYFVGTSSAFFKGVILPKVSASLNAKVTVSDASISPFKQVVLKDFKVETTGPDPLVTAPEVRLRYSLMDIIGGNIHVDEVALVSPTVTLVENPDGSSNLDPITKAQAQKPAEKKEPAKPEKPGKPMQLDLRKIAMTDATVRKIKIYDSSHRDSTEISHINVSLDDMKNGQTGKLTLGADVKVDQHPPAAEGQGSLQAKVEGKFNIALSATAKPSVIQGTTHLAVTDAKGALAEVAGLGANFDCDVSPTEVKQVALRFFKGQTPLGEVRVSGPLNQETMEGKLKVEVLNIDKQVLNLAGAKSGIDFGPTTINSTNEIQLTKSGKMVSAVGQFNLNKLTLTRTNQTTPPLDLSANYDVTVDVAGSNAVLKTFQVNGTQKGNPVMKGDLTSPMTINWGNAASAVGDSTLNFNINRLELADWKPFIGDVAPAGTVNVKLQLISQQAGKLLNFDFSSEIANLTAGSGSNQIKEANITFSVKGKATDMKQFALPELKFGVSRQNQSLVSVTGSGNADQAAMTADFQLTGQASFPPLVQALQRPDANFTSGKADFKLHVVQKPAPGGKAAEQQVTGNFTLADLSGSFGSNSFKGFGSIADLDVAMTPRQTQINKLSGKLTEGGASGGNFQISGSLDNTTRVAQFSMKLSDFNQAGLRAFIEPMLTDKKLVSISLNADASVQYNPEGDSTVKANLQMANLVVNDAKGTLPAKPLEAKMQMDIGMAKKITNIRQFQVTLTPTSRAANQIQLTGQVDSSQTNATQGNLKLEAEAIDVTSYYDLFNGKTTAASGTASGAGAANTGTKTPTQSSSTQTEPEAKTLPFKNFTAAAHVGKFYLHELEITNFLTTVKLDGAKVLLRPFQLSLNGAPASADADVDMSVPGFKYAISGDAKAIPLAPIVNTFQPERKGQLGGSMTAQMKINGVGMTGASLKKSLNGNFDIYSTNLNLAVNNVSNRVMRTVLEVVAQIPEIAKNPTSAATSLAGNIFSSSKGGSGGTSDDLSKSPIQATIFRGTMGNGKVELQQAMVQSTAFQVHASGTITLTDEINNPTLNLPVGIALERSVAERIKLAGNTPTNVTFVQLPDFLTMKGTAEAPKKEINSAGALKLATMSAGGILGGSTGEQIQSIGNLLQGNKGTNAGGTNQTGTKSLLNGLGGLLGGGSAANTNAAGTNKSTNQPAKPAGGLLDQLLNPKK